MTKETDKISVIVPVYNVKNYLESCVQIKECLVREIKV